MTLGDTGVARPQPAPWLPPTANPPSQRGRARQLSGNKPAAAEHPQGPARGTGSAGTAGTRGLSLSMGTGGAGGKRAGGPGPIYRSPAPGTCGSGPARAGTSTAGNGRGAAAHLAPAELGRVGGAGAGLGIPPIPERHERTGRGLCTLSPPPCCPPTRPPGPCPTEGSPPGPRSPHQGCQGLCSGEYRHFTLNIKRRIAFVTYRSQRGVSVDSKRGEKGARGEAGAGGEGGGRLDTAESLGARRGHALQQPSRPENIKPAKRKKGRRGRPMPGTWWLRGGRGRRTGWGAEGGTEIGSQRKEQTTSLKCGASALRGCPLAWHNVRSSPERESHQVYTDLPSHIYNLYWSNS